MRASFLENVFVNKGDSVQYSYILVLLPLRLVMFPPQGLCSVTFSPELSLFLSYESPKSHFSRGLLGRAL